MIGRGGLPVRARRERHTWHQSNLIQPFLCRWLTGVSPPPGSLKLNFDGSWALSGGLGFIIRNSRGYLLLAGSRASDAASASSCEILAGCWGIDMAIPILGGRELCIEGDSLVALARLGGEVGCILPALLQTRREIGKLAKVSFSPVPRVCNSTADALARLARGCNSFFLWYAFEPPPPSVVVNFGLAPFVPLHADSML